MLFYIISSIPILLLFGVLLLRCLAAWGWAPKRLSSLAFLAEPDGNFLHKKTGEWGTFSFALCTRLIILTAAVACVILGTDTPLTLQECFERLRLWDVTNYIQLADKGYAGHTEDGQHLFLVFYPLYVWITRLVKFVIPNTAVAGVLVSTLAYSWGCCWVHKLAFERFGRRTANDAVLFLSAFPFSFFFGTVMTEGLFLLTTAAACYYALKHKWLAFGLWGLLAALTRMTGILVIVPAMIELFKTVRPLAAPIKASLRAGTKKILMALPQILLPFVGVFIYWLLNYLVDGDPFAFVKHQEHWYNGFSWLPQVLEYILHYMRTDFFQSTGWAIWVPQLFFFVAFFLLLAVSAKKPRIPTSLLCYGFAYLVGNYSLSWLISGSRYLACGFVFFIFLAYLTARCPKLRAGIFMAEALFLGVYLFAYTTGAQIM